MDGFTIDSGVTFLLNTMFISFFPAGSISKMYSSSFRVFEVTIDPCASASVATWYQSKWEKYIADVYLICAL